MRNGGRNEKGREKGGREERKEEERKAGHSKKVGCKLQLHSSDSTPAYLNQCQQVFIVFLLIQCDAILFISPNTIMVHHVFITVYSNRRGMRRSLGEEEMRERVRGRGMSCITMATSHILQCTEVIYRGHYLRVVRTAMRIVKKVLS